MVARHAILPASTATARLITGVRPAEHLGCSALFAVGFFLGSITALR